MIDGREPNYICLDTRALKIVRRLSDGERLAFFDQIWTAYQRKLNGDNPPGFPESIIGDLLSQAWDTLSAGFDSYMSRARANPNGNNGKRHGDVNDIAETGHRDVNDIQSNQDHQKDDQPKEDHLNQIKSQLEAEGYQSAMIDEVINRSRGKTINHPLNYFRTALERIKKDESITVPIPAQDFEQRDYSGMPAEDMARLAAEMAEFKANHAAIAAAKGASA